MQDKTTRQSAPLLDEIEAIDMAIRGIAENGTSPHESIMEISIIVLFDVWK